MFLPAILSPAFDTQPRILHDVFCIYGEGNGNTLQYSWLENAMDGGAW